MSKKYTKWVTGMAALATTVAAVGLTGPAAFAGTTLSETGSSLMYPLFQQEWVPAYSKVAPSVTLNPASTGSGTGISDSIAGTVNIGASDAYLAPSQVAKTPGIENIPMAISAQTIMYHVPGISQSKHLRLTGNVLAQIFEGKITKWNDKQIVALNKGIKLPNHPIVTIRRSDGSGDTFLFTQLMTATNAWWRNNIEYGTSVSWPAVKGSIAAEGNSGIVTALSNTPYSVSYVGISYLKTALATKKIGEAAVQNKAGNFELPTPATIQADASAGAKHVPKNESISLVYAGGKNSYPIVNFEYVIVNTKQPNASTALAVKKFLNWAISPTGGNAKKYMTPVNFLPLPTAVKPLSQAQINKIH